MSRFALAASTALATVFSAGIAQADVTADDVWTNISAYLDTLGGTLSVQPARTGNTLSTGELALEWMLPFDAGKVSLRESSFDLVESGDGTVEIVVPDGFELHFAFEPKDKPKFAVGFKFDMTGGKTTASGDPGDVTYVSAFETVTMSLTDLQVPEVANPDAHMTMTMNDLKSEQRVVVDKLVSVSGSTTQGAYDVSFSMNDGKGGTFEQSNKAAGGTGTYSMELPRNGMDIMNLAAAVRGGLMFKADTEIKGYETHQTVMAGAKTVQEQHSVVDIYKIGMRFDKDGIALNGDGTDTSAKMFMPEIIPLEINFDAAKTAGKIALPLTSGEELKTVAMSMEISGLTVGESLWGLIDPGKAIPRDPATLRLDMTAEVKSFVDWLDFMSVKALGDAGEVPGEIHSATLNDLTVEAAGASLVASGAATFDNTDKVTFNGFPKPTGTLDMTLKGSNALIEKLVGMGLVSDEEAMGARMGIGMVAKPAPEEGEDVLKSHIELTDEGQVMANGIRIK